MKTTTTILDIINAKAHREGYNEFFDRQRFQLRKTDDKTNLMYQIATYTDFIRDLTNEEIFGGCSLSDQNTDRYFKHMFLNKFIDREIKFQTLDVFRNKLVSMMLINDKWFCDTYKYFDDMFNGVSRGSTNSGGTTHSDGRGANATLPQDQTSLDLSSNEVPFADETTYNRGDSRTTNHSSSNSSQNSPSVISQMDDIFEKKLNEFDAQLFLQIW